MIRHDFRDPTNTAFSTVPIKTHLSRGHHVDGRRVTVGVSEDPPDVDLPDGGVHDGQLQLGGAQADEDEDTAGLAGEDAAPWNKD